MTIDLGLNLFDNRKALLVIAQGPEFSTVRERPSFPLIISSG